MPEDVYESMKKNQERGIKMGARMLESGGNGEPVSFTEYYSSEVVASVWGLSDGNTKENRKNG